MTIVQKKFELDIDAYKGKVNASVDKEPTSISFFGDTISPNFPNKGMETAETLRKTMVIRRFWVLEISKTCP